MTTLYALGLGIGTKNSKGEWLEVFYAVPLLNPPAAIANAIAKVVGYTEGNQALNISNSQAGEIAQALEGVDTEQAALAKNLINSKRPLVATLIATDTNPASVPEGYLKLHLLSHRLVKPHNTILAGIFGVLPNVAWTNKGAIDVNELPAAQLQARLNGEELEVSCVDKFPKMTNYVVPKGVRVAHTARVRLGAYLGEGTTIMHEGFVNFNAGTEGPAMIEGRISAGVFVGAGSDLGGGSSTMGTLSGGGNIIISIGKESLIGANAGSGIPLGDRCKIESGLYITAGTKVVMLDDTGAEVKTVKARDLAGVSDLVFRRNSISGRVEVVTNKSALQLNSALHKN
ncbi:MAG: 2,3,4,5-tetrahydropyridine-2,6-dicarboxylate N-succinyltransferase [Gammaproteobacteria bacterium]|nr:MAG: 2,3,4,5-tetrahydropyridine-2,6-dicarboxylate N-succinyltransferase [Gammaproteobacteria bacterium]